MPVTKATGYGISITRSQSGDGWVRVALRKHFWSVDAGTRSRPVAETGFYAEGMGETEIVESALREILRAYVDEIS